MKGRKNQADAIARERLKLMMESEPFECNPDRIAQMKKEISDIVTRYYDISADDYEIKVILKQNRKRA